MGRASQKKGASLQRPGMNEPRRQPSPVLHREERTLLRPALHILLITVVGLLVYSNTFHGPFQWDDTDYIVENPMVKDLSFFAEPSRAKGLLFFETFKLRYIGYLTFALNYKLRGFDVFGYHVVNLAIHLINAMLVYFLVLLTLKTPYFIKTGNGQEAMGKGQQPSRQASKPASLQAGKGDTPQNPPLARGEGKGGGSPITSRLSPASHSLFTIHYSRFFALIVALLFVAHPLQTEAVTYVFQRLASLVTLFYLLSLVLYIKGRLSSRQAGKLASYFLSLVCAVLAMKTKENAFTLPLVIALYEFLFFTGPLKSRLLRLTPWLLTMLIIPVTMLASSSTAAEMIGLMKDPASFGFEKISRDEYLFTQFRVIVTYIRLLLLPINQNIDYAYPVYRTLFTLPVFLSFLFLSPLFGSAFWLIFKTRASRQAYKPPSLQPEKGDNPPSSPLILRGEQRGNPPEGKEHGEDPPLRKRGLEEHSPPLRGGDEGEGVGYSLFTIHYLRLIAFGILWFFITLSVESSIIPLPMMIDEYRAYLPSVGFFIAIMGGVFVCVNRFAAQRAKGMEHSDEKSAAYLLTPLRYALGALLIVVLALGSATYARNSVWKDKISLWEDVVSKSPSLPRGHNNLGIAYKESGSMERAIEQYRIATQLKPDFPLPHMNMGNALDASGRPDEAIKEYEIALNLDPENWLIRLNLGKAYGKKGWSDRAIEQLNAALKLNPYSEGAYNNLGNVYVQKGEAARAIESYKQAVRLKPDYAEAYFNLGVTYEEQGKFTEAVDQYRKALRLDANYVEAHYNLGRVFVQAGRTDDGLEELGIAVRLSPSNVSYRNTLGILYGQKGLRNKAIEQFEEAVRLAPDNQSFRRNLKRAKGLKESAEKGK
jgi:tetratricopeptide (TPR) repeat protein